MLFLWSDAGSVSKGKWMTKTFQTNITVMQDSDGIQGIFIVPTENGKKVLTMAEYITKERVIEWFRPYGHTDKGIPYFGLVTDIREMKAADVAPVVHGWWEPTKTPFMNECEDCSVCGYRTIWGHRFNYCPNCGARMDGGDKNG